MTLKYKDKELCKNCNAGEMQRAAFDQRIHPQA